MTTKIYRIRDKATGQCYYGGAYGGLKKDGGGASYETKAACKCVWRHKTRRGWGKVLPPAEIVELTVTETPGATEDLA